MPGAAVSKKIASACCFLFVLGLAPRLWFSFTTPFWKDPIELSSEYTKDAVDYDKIAQNVAAGHGFSLSEKPPYQPTLKRAPAYPLFLAFLYRFLGRSCYPVFVVQSLLGAAVPVLLFLMGFWMGGWAVGLLCGILNALNPSAISYAAEISTEELAIFQFALTGFLMTAAFRRRSLGLGALAGAALGWTLLSKTALAPVVPFLALWGLGTPLKKSERLKAAAVIIFCTALTFSPWLIRNQKIFGVFSPGMIGGMTLHARTFDRGVRADLGSPEYQRDFYGVWTRLEKEGVSELQIAEHFKKEAVQNVRLHPFRYLSGALIELDAFLGLRFFFPFSPRGYEHEGIGDPGRWVLFKSIPRLLFYLVCLAGMVLAMRRTAGEALPLLLLTAVFTLSHIFMAYSGFRYAEPLMPFFFLFFSIALRRAGQRFFSFVRPVSLV